MKNKKEELSDNKKEAIRKYKQLRKDDPDFANQWGNCEEDFLEWYEEVYLKS